MHGDQDEERDDEDGHDHRPGGRKQSEERAPDHEHQRQRRSRGWSEHSDQNERTGAPKRGQPEEEGERIIEMRNELDNAEREEHSADRCPERPHGSR